MIGDHVPCEYSMSTIWTFDHLESRHTYTMQKVV